MKLRHLFESLGLLDLCLDLAVILNMLMHEAVQSFLIKQIIIPKLSQIGSGGAAAF